MEIEFFCRRAMRRSGTSIGASGAIAWYIELGIRPANLHLREHDADELAHYAAGCADVEYDFPFGRSELEGIANRTDFDLRQHMQMSGKDLALLRRSGAERRGRRYLPHVIEPSAGADRGTLAFLCDAYSEDEVGGEPRTVLKLHPRLAPIKAAVFPLVKKDGMPEKALAIYRDAEAALQRLLRREGRDRPPVSAAGRGRHAVLHHGRRRDAERRDRHRARARQLRADSRRCAELDASSERGLRRPAASERTPRRALVMLDRDGVINEDSAEFIKSVAEWRPMPRQPRSDCRIARGRATGSPS